MRRFLTAWNQNKSALIEAHRNGDWEKACLLSQEREKLKLRATSRVGFYRHCSVCGVAIARGERCSLHYRMRRYYSKALPA